MTADTIAAIATAPGVGGLGVVRVSGPDARAIALAVTARALRPRRASFCGFLASTGQPIDEGIALFFPGPRSFTGEDVLELQGHGGPVVLDLLLSRCLELGARPARPGEFSERAFLNGKLDLTQAEAIADLVESTTSLSARLAMRSLQGAFSRRVHALVDDLVRLRTGVEATLDFPEEDIDDNLSRDLRERLIALIVATDQVLFEAHQGERIRDGLHVVIAGRPNSGKSSLLNALVQYDAAIVTPVPGTTRDLLRCNMEIAGLPVTVIDTAGIRETQELVEQEGVRRARAQLGKADQILWVYDGSLGLDSEELSGLPQAAKVTLIRNKIDLVTPLPAPVNTHGFIEISISALTGAGIDDLRRHLRATSGVQGLGEGSFVARRRHLDALRRGLTALHSSKVSFETRLGPEVVALELRDAQHAFGEITGEVTSDDLLGKIFSTFCIGK
ncbi:tRNA uridine-5-carboxymethylaminomethyl(34) synthesis GTPase MnmE [uncultured Lamprocystis sp.]|jgi:tRNA modification GTPase|uniref:tRNA uridine-5-carboxymethylaminomethyl(34) synthesis GTPase MnmE n=1 Tax=uncultured Lamprocystis sp. TaxID=543132 RepID=UPI0025CD1EEB|nr:tRNA uridine-5-carboxymethylaminomethyl(34) synthesis GTPase MnmE [uncultured Lamprocystis sp.]